MPEIRIERVHGKSPDSIFMQISDIHAQEIEEGFLATMGPKFLMKLYKTVAVSPYTFLFVAMSDDKVAGFIAGSLDTSKFYMDFMKRAGISVMPVLAPKLFSPARFKRIIETLLYPAKKQNSGLPSSEILNFCTSRDFQRQGVGKKLFYALNDEFLRVGVKEIKIITGGNQVKAQSFYEGLGAVLVNDIEIHKNVKSLIYKYNLDSAKETAISG